MKKQEFIQKIINARQSLAQDIKNLPYRKVEAEGGCGVVGLACNIPVAARHLLPPLQQMRNRGNGKGGGIAAAGFLPEEWGVSQEILEKDTLLIVAYLDPSIRPQVEKEFIFPLFEIDSQQPIPLIQDWRQIPGLEVRPPDVVRYFVRVKPSCVKQFADEHGLQKEPKNKIEEEMVYQNSARLNGTFYSATGDKRAFVLSHGKNLLVLKLVGYGDDVLRAYQLENLHAHVWIGHHRYPTKGKVWHPGGAHPFVGLNEALVHNGDFANYFSICEYLAQRNIRPLFLTDTEVSVLLFDLLHRTYGYPLEYVMEALAPTTERDFTLLPLQKQHIYHLLQTTHMHGSPDGPWFFLIAQSQPTQRAVSLIGITDTSMLRPQVFALQSNRDAEGKAVEIGLAASEKQAIDAVLASLAKENKSFCPRADLYWNARGGSHADGGAFVFTVRQPSTSGERAQLECTNKFGVPIEVPFKSPTLQAAGKVNRGRNAPKELRESQLFSFAEVVPLLPNWSEGEIQEYLARFETLTKKEERYRDAILLLTQLIDRRYFIGEKQRSRLLALFDATLLVLLDRIQSQPPADYIYLKSKATSLKPVHPDQTLILDARAFPSEGHDSLALHIVRMAQQGFRHFLVAYAQGHRFIANGLGPASQGIQIDVYGSSGDYVGSGIDGAQVFVHGSAQDQVAQIMKEGKLVIHGDVGQTFLYAAKGGKAFVLGNAAGRPLINAVGKPRVVINGTCLDYLAESFMSGDPLHGGGFVVLNALAWDEQKGWVDLEEPYPGGNLFSLASGGAIYIRDPHKKVSADQLNGGKFAEFTDEDWDLLRPYLEENELLFGIPVSRLLQVDGKPQSAQSVYRKIRPGAVRALQAEEAWVKRRE